MRRSCTNRSAPEHLDHNNPIAVGTKTTQVEVTLLSAVGDDCKTLAVPRDATPEAKQLRLNQQCWLSRMVAERGLKRPVTTGYAD